MNTNDETMATMPQTPENANAPKAGNQKPTFKLSKQPKKGMNTGQKIALGLVGGAAAAGAGAGIAYAVNHIGNDNLDVAELNTDHSTDDAPVQDVYVHETHIHETPGPEINIVVTPGEDVVKEPEIPAEPVTPTEPVTDTPTAVVDDLMVTDLNDDGEYEITASLIIGDERMLLIDTDLDGVFNYAVADFDGSGDIDNEEFVDISDRNLTVDECYTELLQTDPDKAYAFIEGLTVFYEEGEENPYMDVNYDETIDDNVIVVDEDGNEVEVSAVSEMTDDGITVTSDDVSVDTVSDEVVESNDDSMMVETVNEIAPEAHPDTIEQDVQWTDASHDLGGDDLGAAGHDMVDDAIDC